MRSVVYLPAVRKDQTRMSRRGQNVQKLLDAVNILVANETLPLRYNAHKLRGDWLGYWECHLAND